MEKLTGRHTIRLQGYDYSFPGYYFITICSYRHRTIFGKIEDDRFSQSTFGQVVEEELKNSVVIRPFLELDEFIIMPNHIHFILIIDPDESKNAQTVSVQLADFMKGFKAKVTSRIRKKTNTDSFKVWQRNYYEHIIRNEKELYQIRHYIKYNTLKWHDDKYYTSNR